MHTDDDFAFEDSPGIPAPLPKGEHVLWQGSPDWRTLARRPFHVGTVALWFVALALFETLWTLSQGQPLAAALPGVTKCVFLGLSACAILALLAWLNARVSIYTLTNRRLLIRFGVALQITMNLPFSEIVTADLRLGGNGIGDIPLGLQDTRRVGYVVLWPHVRPWRLTRPEPMLRAVPDAARVAGLLATAMREEAASVAGTGAELAAARPAASPRPTSAAADVGDGSPREGGGGGDREGVLGGATAGAS